MKLDLRAPLTLKLAKRYVKTLDLPFGLFISEVVEEDGYQPEIGGPMVNTEHRYIRVNVRSGPVPMVGSRRDLTNLNLAAVSRVGSDMGNMVHNLTSVVMTLLCHEVLETISKGGERLYEPHGVHDSDVISDALFPLLIKTAS